jgi:hypothetical protein
MKIMTKLKYIVLTGLLITFFNCNKANGQAPKAVQEAFKAKYPNENDPDFELDANGNYEAHFKKKGEKYRADFSPEGTWIETENSIKDKELPEAIKKVIKEKYADEHITEVEHVTSASKGEFYDVEFRKKGKNMDVEFRANGNIIN